MLKEIVLTILGWLLVWAIAALLVFGGAELSYRLYQHYAPSSEQVRRETYEQSRAFQEGTVRDLENMQREFATTNDAGKAAIRAVAQHRLADVPNELLTTNLRKFKSELETN